MPFVQFYWLLDNSNSIVATIRYRSNVPDPMVSLVYETSPKYRNKGFGKRMLKELIQVLLAQKISKITLGVSKSNVSSIKVIEANKGVHKGITHRTSNNEELNEYELLLCK